MGSSLRPAIQLYSVRDLSEPLPEVISRAGDTGFAGVEFADRFREADPAETAAALEESGVVPVGVHADFSGIEAAVRGENDLIDRCKAIGCKRIIAAHVPPRHFRSNRAVGSLSRRLANVADTLDTHDIELGYHTARYDPYPLLPDPVEVLFDHTPLPEGAAVPAMRWLARLRRGDPTRIPETAGLRTLLSRTAPEDLFFELETAEVCAAGFDPAGTVSLLEGRVPLVHLRDVARTGRFGAYVDAPNGEGAVDFESVVDAASRAGVEWLVYENETDCDPATKLTDGMAFFDQLLAEDHCPEGTAGVGGH